MKETIVLYKGSARYDALCVFADELIKELENISGCEVYIIDTKKDTDWEKEILYLSRLQIKAFIAFNGIVSDVKFSDGSYFQNIFEAPYYGFYVDHPIYHDNRLNSKIVDYNVFFVDKGQCRYAEKFYENIKTVNMIAHGGIKSDNIKPYRERKQDIVFFGSYVNPDRVLDEIDSLKDETVRNLIYNVIQIMLGNLKLTCSDAFDKFIETNGITLSKEEYRGLSACLVYCDKYVRNYIRDLVIKTIVESGIVIEVYGEGWNNFKYAGSENFLMHESVAYVETGEIMNNAKVVLNVMPLFKEGSHERIFMTMLNGAVCLTDTSTYIDEMFHNQKDIVLYSVMELYKLPEQIKKLLSDDNYGERISMAGYENAVKNHTWRNRAEQILSIMEYNEKQRRILT